jgi:transposase
MGFIYGAHRHEEIRFPERLDDYMAAENPVRFLDALVDHLNRAALGLQRATPAATGRPAYDPAELLQLYIYGYLDRLRSSRRLAQETHRNVEWLWL